MDDELLDVFDERGWHVGVKPRADVHRDGDWHQAFHLWVVNADGVLLQRRARDKASWPGYLDASAAGHLIAGEAVRDGLREAEEELGAAYAFDDLESLGMHRVDDAERSGVVNRELQHVFAVRDARPLETWRDFDRVELDGLVLVGHDGFLELARALEAGTDRGEDLAVPARAWDGVAVVDARVTPGELVPAPYLSTIAPALRRLGRRR
ncbi:MAG TPA: NUDIX domain-containing protein [Baekduia sp.]|uniref:NUDIX hydrolase n=1 Tax=Baekduia sp. TaxID=2600305 RepID=UPI002D7847F5|nr:NUDIX domain-containing protein [Baekduia sp.]HET6509617.1 NUDIX domain-containing protein [Baekduia sp.]